MKSVTVFAPARISLAGGGTDLAAFYHHQTGRVLSLSISLGVRITATALLDTDLRLLHLPDLEEDLWFRPKQIPPTGASHLAALAVDTWAGNMGCEVAIQSDFPPGTGLGGSGALCVAIYVAIMELRGRVWSKRKAAREASRLEIELAARPIGLQDQYASALGGINRLTFSRNGRVLATPLELSEKIHRELAGSLMLFYRGKRRDSSQVLQGQKASTEVGEAGTIARLTNMAEIASRMHLALRKGYIADVGMLLDEAWQLKRGVASGISDDIVDRSIIQAQAAGAWGGKVCGAGAGGHLLIMAPPAAREEICAALAELGWSERDFDMDIIPNSRGVRLVDNPHA